MVRFLTFDLGTTLYKVALLLALERAVPPIQRPQPGWAILSGEEVSGLLSATMAKLRTNVGEAEWRRIAAISYATQANTFSLTSGGNAGTYISWSDQRATEGGRAKARPGPSRRERLILE